MKFYATETDGEECKKVEHVVCCICEMEDSKTVFDLGDIRIVRCKHCGLIYDNPRYSEASLSEYYRDYYYPKDILGDVESFLRTFRRNYFIWEKCISQIESFTGHKGKLLDAGCGVGYFLKVAYLLKSGGILFLAVPNFDYLMVKILRKKQSKIENPTHMYHYTWGSLCHLLTRAGFKNIQRLIYWGGGRKQFGILGQTVQWLFRAARISSEIRVIATL